MVPIKKDKLFFFADYEAERFDFPKTTNNISVFTTRERQGDVSELVAAGKAIVDPLTGQPFPGNVIPQNRLSPAALAIINSQHYPTPINDLLQSNAHNTVATKTNDDQGDGRLDYAMSDKDHFMGRFSYANITNPTINSADLLYNPYNLFLGWNFVTGYTRNLSPNTLNEARLGVNYDRIGQNQISSNFSGNAGQLFPIGGLTSSILPAMGFSGGYVSNFGNKDSATNYYDTSIQYEDVLSWVHGKHNTRFGFQGWRIRTNGFFNSNNGEAGSLSFGSIYSGSPESNFLLGLPSSVGVGSVGPDWGQRNSIFAGFVQDDWKITQRLVANLGLRYETHTPFVEAHDRQVNWDPQTGNLELPGQNGNSRALYDSYNGYGNYQPRIGFAFQATPKTTVRASYGLSSFMEGTGLGLRLPGNPPRAVSANANYTKLAYPTTTLDQGFSPIAVPAGCTIAGLKTADPLCYKGVILYSWDKKVQPAHSNQYSLILQQELWPSTTAQIGYVGQTTKHLTNAQLLTQGVWVSPGVVNPSPYFSQNPPGPRSARVYLRNLCGGTPELPLLAGSVAGTPEPRLVVSSELHLVALHDQLAGILWRGRPVVRSECMVAEFVRSEGRNRSLLLQRKGRIHRLCYLRSSVRARQTVRSEHEQSRRCSSGRLEVERASNLPRRLPADA